MRTYAGLIASLIGCRLALAFVSLDFKTAGQRLMLQWWFLAAIAIYGALGVLLLKRTGFSGMSTTRRGALLAALHGALVGLATIAVDILRPLPSIHHPLPEGLLVYWYGGVISEIWFHLLPVPLFVFAGSNLLLRGRHQERVFWIALVILSAWEGRRFFAQPETWDAIEIARNAVTYLANASEIWLFRRFGFMAAITQRMTGYALWHVAWPLLRG